MPRDDSSRDDPAGRFLQGVEFIEAHLAEPFALAEVAAAAGVSPWHYARMFQALTGETVMGYARKRRLSEAAHKLANGGSSRLIDLALESGFESQAGFTRAFKRQFGITPGEVRRIERRWLPRIRAPLDRAALSHLTDAITLEPAIIERGDISFVGLREEVRARQKSDGPGLWQRFWPQASRISYRCKGGPALGVVEVVDRETGTFAYTAAVEVERIDAVPDGLVAKTLEGGRFAVFTHTLTSPDIGGELRRTFQYIYGTWVPKSDVCLRAWYDIELYDARFDAARLCGEIDIYVPIM